MIADDEERRCRYCFEGEGDSPELELISPCQCRGHLLYTHRACLTRWQRRQERGTATCEVCKTAWTVRLDVLDRELFLRSVKTNPRYPPTDAEMCDEALQAALTASMTPGSLILQTPARAAIARDLPSQLPGGLSAQSQLALFTHMLSLHRMRHWLHGTYLILSRGKGDATDQSDSIVAVNLARLATPEEARDGEAVNELKPLLDAMAPSVPPLLIGGPCHQTQPICLVELPEGLTSLPTRGDSLAVLNGGVAAAAEAPAPAASSVMAAEEESSAAAAEEEEDQRASPTPPPQQERTVVATEPAVAAALVQSHPGTRVVIVQGCAVWSTAQLLSEVSRHKWGLAAGRGSDIPFGGGPPAVERVEEEGGTPVPGPPPELWEACWRERSPTATAGIPPSEGRQV